MANVEQRIQIPWLIASYMRYYSLVIHYALFAACLFIYGENMDKFDSMVNIKVWQGSA